MLTSAWFGASDLLKFLLVLARLSGIVVFLPWPGLRGAQDVSRVVVTLAMAVAFFPLAPSPSDSAPGSGQLLAWIGGEAAFGLTVGLLVGLVSEAFLIAAQMAGLQAGFSYASTIDPNSEADSAVLQILAQLTSNLLFFACGFDRIVVQAFLRSLGAWPLGGWGISMGLADTILRLGSAAFELGLRLALPVVGLLMLTDLTIALLGRLNSQLQLLSLSFPLKMLGALALLAALAPVYPRVYQAAMGGSVAPLLRMAGGSR